MKKNVLGSFIAAAQALRRYPDMYYHGKLSIEGNTILIRGITPAEMDSLDVSNANSSGLSWDESRRAWVFAVPVEEPVDTPSA